MSCLYVYAVQQRPFRCGSRVLRSGLGFLDSVPVQVFDCVPRNRGSRDAFEKVEHYLDQLSGVCVSGHSELVFIDHVFKLLDSKLVDFAPGLFEVLGIVYLCKAGEDLGGGNRPALVEHFELSEDGVDDVWGPPDDFVGLDGADEHLRGYVLFEREPGYREEDLPVLFEV